MAKGRAACAMALRAREPNEGSYSSSSSPCPATAFPRTGPGGIAPAHTHETRRSCAHATPDSRDDNGDAPSPLHETQVRPTHGFTGFTHTHVPFVRSHHARPRVPHARTHGGHARVIRTLHRYVEEVGKETPLPSKRGTQAERLPQGTSRAQPSNRGEQPPPR